MVSLTLGPASNLSARECACRRLNVFVPCANLTPSIVSRGLLGVRLRDSVRIRAGLWFQISAACDFGLDGFARCFHRHLGAALLFYVNPPLPAIPSCPHPPPSLCPTAPPTLNTFWLLARTALARCPSREEWDECATPPSLTPALSGAGAANVVGE
jgi:hypothetical protein